MSADLRRLALSLTALERNVRALQTQPQLGNSSVEDSGINTYVNDSLRLTVGLLPDGTTGSMAVNGPAGPAPSAPECVEIAGGFRIEWDGLDAGGSSVRPLDWQRTEIHAQPGTADFTPSGGTLRGTLESPQRCRAYVAIPPNLGTTWRVRLLARNTSGAGSTPSVGVTIVLAKRQALLNLDLNTVADPATRDALQKLVDALI